jgi:hypothetical protein
MAVATRHGEEARQAQDDEQPEPVESDTVVAKEGMYGIETGAHDEAS